MDVVLRELSKGGYNAVWKVLSAGSLRFPHRRNRVWILAYPCGRRLNWNVVLRAIACKKPKKPALRSFDPKEFKLLAGKVAPAKWRSKGYNHPQPLFLRGDNGIPSQLDKLRIGCLGNAVVPQCAALAFELLIKEALVARRLRRRKLIANYPLPKRW
jgi:DNA (cytosine-5)-methyltransferase 1